VFGPEEIRILVIAFDDAWQRLQKCGVRLEGGRETESAREWLAKTIIELAELGESDPRLLSDQALFGLAKALRSDLWANGPKTQDDPLKVMTDSATS
jgi:hypothetical protein